MKTENLHNDTFLAKWLAGSLSPKELEAFQNSDDFETYTKIVSTLGNVIPPQFDAEASLEQFHQNFVPQRSLQNSQPQGNSQPVFPQIKLQPVLPQSKLQENIDEPTARPKLISIAPAIRYAMQIAAVLVMVFVSYQAINHFYPLSPDQQVVAQNAQKSSTTLPDQSEVTINAGSSLSYQENRWEKNRKVALKGEAHFSVAKGSVFEVSTALGKVEVLGTKFNVIARENLFEVSCFEGKVSVGFNGKNYLLSAGQGIQFLNNTQKSFNLSQKNVPSWMNNESHFNSLPFKMVLEELERQYDVKVIANGINTSQLFTGSFAHENLEVALQSICLPLQLQFTDKKDGTVSLEHAPVSPKNQN